MNFRNGKEASGALEESGKRRVVNAKVREVGLGRSSCKDVVRTLALG